MTTTQAETIRALVVTNAAAKRCPRVHRKFELADPPEHPTAWDNWHATLDDLLDDLER